MVVYPLSNRRFLPHIRLCVNNREFVSYRSSRTKSSWAPQFRQHDLWKEFIVGSTVDYQNKTHPNYGQNSQVGLILVVCQKMPFLLSFYSFIQKLNVSNLNRKALIRNAVFRLLLLTYFFSTSFEKNFSFFIVYKCNIQSAVLAGIQIY